MISSRTKEKILDLNNLYFRSGVGIGLYLASRALYLLKQRTRSLSLLLTAIRYSYYGPAVSFLAENREVFQGLMNELTTDGVNEHEALTRSIVLSYPEMIDGKLKKGVLLITFTRTISYFLKYPKFQRLNDLFVFVLEPSWAGYADADILAFLYQADHCLVQSTEVNDRAFINSLFPGGYSLTFGASNWVDDRIFIDQEKIKSIDSIYVANMSPIKRVYRYLEAVKEVVAIKPDFKAKLVCAHWGGGKSEEIDAFVKDNGLQNNVTLSPPLSQKELMDAISESKCSVLASLKEGSSRILFESMFLNVPVICFSENIGVNKEYINEFTGLLINDSMFGAGLLALSKDWRRYAPREWALQHISPLATTQHLSRILQLRFGSIVNDSLFVKVNQPEVRYQTGGDTILEENNELFSVLAKDQKSLSDYIEALHPLSTKITSCSRASGRSPA